jgi:hypothetical protein
MSSLASKDLFSYVSEEIAKNSQYPGSSSYGTQLSRSQTASGGSASITSTVNSLSGSLNLLQAINDILEVVVPPRVVSGFSVEAFTPISNKVLVKAGTGVVGGKQYTLKEDLEIEIPFDSETYVFYVNAFSNGVKIERSQYSNKLSIAKIIVTNPGITSRVANKINEEDSNDAYIVNFKQYYLFGDAYGKLEEDSIEMLRNNIGDILADNLIGNLRLSENMKITNTQGSLELNSDSLKLFDVNNNNLAKFNQKGVYFYDVLGTEMARFTNIDSRIGNILITKNALQSGNYSSGIAGFKIQDSGNAEFNNMVVRGTIYATLGEIGGFTITSDRLYGGIIQTNETVGTGSNGVVMDDAGLRVYNDILGLVVNLPSNGDAPVFSSGTITSTVFELNTNAILRTSETVGDGTALSYGILINNTGIYGCGANQLIDDANFKIDAFTGDAYFNGQIVSSQGQIGSVTITSEGLFGGLIEGALIRSPQIESSSTYPKIKINSDGISFQVTALTGTYGPEGSGLYGFLYGDGTLYGGGITALLFKEDFPILTILSEQSVADIRLYNRGANPTSGTHEVGDLICVNGKLKICTLAGSPGTFTTVGTQT